MNFYYKEQMHELFASDEFMFFAFGFVFWNLYVLMHLRKWIFIFLNSELHLHFGLLLEVCKKKGMNDLSFPFSLMYELSDL